jgi:HAD superfamily hydrolase (TIGR01509 family)
MLPDALLLDLDGTLIDSESTHAESIAQYFDHRGIALDDEERAFVIGHAWQEIYAFLRVEERLGVGLLELQQEAVRFKDELMARGELHMPVLPGGRELVEEVHAAGVAIAIVSGSSRAEIEQVLPKLGIEPRLRFYMGAEDYANGKPAPDGYLGAAQRLGVECSRCLVIEDSQAGITSAIVAGMRVVATRAANPAPGTPGHQDQSAAHRLVDGLEHVNLDLIRAVMREGGKDA